MKCATLIMILLFAMLGDNLMAQKKNLSLDDIFASDKFAGKTVADVQWLPDGSAFAFTRINDATGETDIYRHTVKTGEETLILDGAGLTLNGQKVTMTAYQTTGRQNHLLITGPIFCMILKNSSLSRWQKAMQICRMSRFRRTANPSHLPREIIFTSLVWQPAKRNS